MSDDRETHTGGGANIEGDVNTGSGDFSGRDHIEQKVAIYTASHAAQRGELMADVAAEIWKTIGDLNRLLGELKTSVDVNSRATEKQAQSIENLGQRSEQQYRALEAQVSTLRQIERALRGTRIQMPEPTDDHLLIQPLPWWQPYATPALLTLILLVIILYLATGGQFP